MGYWIHVEDLPTGGGGGGGNDGCLGCLTCLGILAGVFGIWYVKENFAEVLSFAIFIGTLASAYGIIYLVRLTEFEKPYIIAGIIGFAVGACFTNKIVGVIGLVATGLMGHIGVGLILAVAVMYLYFYIDVTFL